MEGNLAHELSALFVLETCPECNYTLSTLGLVSSVPLQNLGQISVHECAYQNDPGKLFHYLRELSHPKSLFIQSFTIPSLLLIRISKHLSLIFILLCSPPVIYIRHHTIDSLPSPTDQLSSIVIDALDVFEGNLCDAKAFESCCV